MRKLDPSRDPAIHAVIVALLAAILTLDSFTQLGVADWCLYIIPLALCILQSRERLPFVVAAVITVLLFVGYWLSPPGVNPFYGQLNRGIAMMVVWVTALLSSRVILEKTSAARLAWIQKGQVEINTSMLGEQDIPTLARGFLQTLASYAGAHVGAAYRFHEGRLERIATFAGGAEAADAAASLAPGEGLAGQAFASGESMLVSDLPPGYLTIRSATGKAEPTHVIVAPIRQEGRPAGVIELGFVGRDVDLSRQRELLDVAGEEIGIALRSALYRQRLQELLAETQQQSEELQAQQEELRVSNEELEEQGRILRESQTRMENQHAELEQTNVQLEEQTQRLERQKQELVKAQEAIAENARTLERTSRYKSEFLANMSHELRTPLNSSLILAKLLADNAQGNLNDEQVRYARTIHASNNDLLTLINDILDLSKIEAGQVEITPEPVPLEDVLGPLEATFQPIADERKVRFRIERAEGLPASITTDPQRLQQVLKNLLSNAFKFTSKGEVVLNVSVPSGGRIAFAVRDTGIGIPAAKLEAVFEPFRQADGTTSRQYGGTGLGLSISRELSSLLGGYVYAKSTPGVGSVFTLELPQVAKPRVALRGTPAPVSAPAPPAVPPPVAAASAPVVPAVSIPPAPRDAAHIEDDRTRRTHGDRLILVVEDDVRFARVLYDLAHELGFDCVHAVNAQEGFELARRLKPSGVLLDVRLPGESGLQLLERIKRDPAVRHIPVHMVSVDDHAQQALGLGAIGYALKPVARDDLVKAIGRIEERIRKNVSRVLVVEDDATLRRNIGLLLQGDRVEIQGVGTVAEALARLEKESFDCLVTDLQLPDASGYELLERLSRDGRHAMLPVIVYTGRALSREDETRLRRYSKSIIIKGARSPERLLDEVTLFLHRVESSLPPDKQNLLRRVRQRDEAFEGRRILLAEDDVRNIFALSRVIEPLGAQLDIARNGQEAVDHVARGNVDLVLMDIMMPVKDGLQAIREIRARRESATLPIIAITAKAMADDRRQCLEAGANDYIAKPIDIDRLVSLCRVWLSK